jgi:hypothetical protein
MSAAETGSPASRLLQFSRRAWVGETGFSRESYRRHTAELSVLRLASSRLKPVPLKAPRIPVGPALAGKPLISHKSAFDLELDLDTQKA